MRMVQEGTGRLVTFWVGALSSLSSLSTFGKNLTQVPEKHMIQKSTGLSFCSRSLTRKLYCEESDGRTILFIANRVSGAPVFLPTLLLVS